MTAKISTGIPSPKKEKNLAVRMPGLRASLLWSEIPYERRTIRRVDTYQGRFQEYLSQHKTTGHNSPPETFLDRNHFIDSLRALAAVNFAALVSGMLSFALVSGFKSIEKASQPLTSFHLIFHPATGGIVNVNTGSSRTFLANVKSFFS